MNGPSMARFAWLNGHPDTITKRNAWRTGREVLFSRGHLADEYVHAHSRCVEDLMTRDVVSVLPNTPLNTVVDQATTSNPSPDSPDHGLFAERQFFAN